MIELREVVGFGDEPVIERDLCLLLTRVTAGAVIVGLHPPVVTTATLRLFVRLAADRHGIPLCVTARDSRAVRALQFAGLRDMLRVTATLAGAKAMGAVCAPASPGRCGRFRPRRAPGLKHTSAPLSVQIGAVPAAATARPPGGGR